METIEAIYEKGETVRLASGGPLMTISKLKENNLVECVWFNADDEVREHDFDVDLLLPDEDIFDLDEFEIDEDEKDWEDSDEDDEEDEEGDEE